MPNNLRLETWTHGKRLETWLELAPQRLETWTRAERLETWTSKKWLVNISASSAPLWPGEWGSLEQLLLVDLFYTRSAVMSSAALNAQAP